MRNFSRLQYRLLQYHLAIRLKTTIPSNSLRFDFRELKCPLLLVRAKQCLKQGQVGDCFVFRVTDRSFVTDMSKLADKHGFELKVQSESHGEWCVSVLLNQRILF